jgi:hypothetical protein
MDPTAGVVKASSLFFPISTTARCGLWPVVDFRNNNFFYCVGLLAPRQTPNLEDQGIPFCLGHHS